MLGLVTLVAWADGERTYPELRTLATFRDREGVNDKVRDSFSKKWEESEHDHDTLFKSGVAAVKGAKKDQKARVCAWMWNVALSSGAPGDEGKAWSDTHDWPPTWNPSASNVSETEKKWIDKALKELKVDAKEMTDALARLPRLPRD